MPASFTMDKNIGDVLLHEAPDFRSREAVIILAGDGAERALKAGEVIGKITHGAVTEDHAGNTGDGVMGAVTLGALALVGDYVLTCLTAGSPTPGAASEDHAGNTGNGVMGAITVGSKAEIGDYLLTCVEAVADGGVFQVESPSGYSLPDLTVAVAYDTDHLDMTLADGATDFIVGDVFTITVAAVDADSGQFQVVDPSGRVLPPLTVAVAYAGDHLNMTLADGATDFIVGDAFTLSVAKGSEKSVALDLDAKDGSQNGAGVMLFAATAPDGTDAESLAAVRDAIVRTGALIWPTGITADQKTAAQAQLEAVGIFARQEV